jgi:subtilisin family serine protease
LTLLARMRTAFAVLTIASLVACGGGGGSSTPPVSTATATPTTSPTSSPGSVAGAFECPTSETDVYDGASSSRSASAPQETRRLFKIGKLAPLSSVIAVSYRPAAISNPSTIEAHAAQFGALKIADTQYSRIGLATRLISVKSQSVTSALSAMRQVPGVVVATQVQRRTPTTVNASYYGTDPYFVAVPNQTQATAGQWDMGKVSLGYAFDYSQSSNGSGITNANAIGSTGVKLAIIDTGMDLTHPQLAKATVARTRCFITNEAGTAQSTSDFVVDEWGHGTDVTGIADSSPNNDYAFVGDAGNVSLMLYRVFPDPDDNCTNENSNDDQCGAADTDIASAIDDAVASGANVISMSLGGGSCTNGTDDDPVEGNAVEAAISAGVIVVAAAGNGAPQTTGVSAPGCDAGVIAVGATGLADGTLNGAGNSNGTATDPIEYVASYSQYGSTNTTNSTSSWGLVAPGADPNSTTDLSATAAIDYYHWIENIWTSTPYVGSTGDESFTGQCDTDGFGEAGNCRTLIAGTSMATPHVAGAAALILSVSGSTYASPTAMFQLLCETADNISDPHQGCGRLNVYRAMAKALNDPVQPTPEP